MNIQNNWLYINLLNKATSKSSFYEAFSYSHNISEPTSGCSLSDLAKLKIQFVSPFLEESFPFRTFHSRILLSINFSYILLLLTCKGHFSLRIRSSNFIGTKMFWVLIQDWHLEEEVAEFPLALSLKIQHSYYKYQTFDKLFPIKNRKLEVLV